MNRYRIRIMHDGEFVAEGCNGKPLPEPREVLRPTTPVVFRPWQVGRGKGRRV